MENPHFIFDFETIGQSIFNSPTVACAYFVFDWDRFTSDNPYTFKELVKSVRYDKLDLQEELDNGCTYTKRDTDWWDKQDPEVRDRIITPNSEVDISHKQLISNIESHIKQSTNTNRVNKWWTRSNAFDPPFLERLCDVYMGNRSYFENQLPFWLVRDTRTYIDTRFNFKLKKNGFVPIDDEELWAKFFREHDPIHDIAADILRLQRCERLINEVE